MLRPRWYARRRAPLPSSHLLISVSSTEDSSVTLLRSVSDGKLRGWSWTYSLPYDQVLGRTPTTQQLGTKISTISSPPTKVYIISVLIYTSRNEHRDPPIFVFRTCTSFVPCRWWEDWVKQILVLTLATQTSILQFFFHYQSKVVVRLAFCMDKREWAILDHHHHGVR